MEVCSQKMTTAIELIKMLYNEGYFSTWRSQKEVKEYLEEKGFNFSNQLILLSLKNATKKGFLTKKIENKKIKFSQREPPEIKIKKKKFEELNEVLSNITSKKLGERFQQDIRELNTAFTYDCGNSAAFLLRKILEKTIFFVFAKNNKTHLIKNKTNNQFIGLDSMIDLVSREKINGVPILLPKTAKELRGIKFLGDSAAHDYLADIEVSEINHQLPYWTMAIKQLSEKI